MWLNSIRVWILWKEDEMTIYKRISWLRTRDVKSNEHLPQYVTSWSCAESTMKIYHLIPSQDINMVGEALNYGQAFPPSCTIYDIYSWSRTTMLILTASTSLILESHVFLRPLVKSTSPSYPRHWKMENTQFCEQMP